MRANLNGVIVFLFYLVTMAVGSLTIIATSWNELQLFVGIIFISLIFFMLINIKNLGVCVHALFKTPGLSIKMCISLCFMILPIFYTQKHGVSTVFYSLMFSIVIAGLGLFFTKKYLGMLVQLILMVVLITYDKHDVYHYLTILGPIGGYTMLRNARKIADANNMNVSQLMCLRYIILGFVGLILCPFLNFHLGMLHFTDIYKVLLIAFFMNIIPIYCSQYIALKMSPNFLSQGISLLPFTTFLIAYMFYGQTLNKIELIYSMFITIPLIWELGQYYLSNARSNFFISNRVLYAR